MPGPKYRAIGAAFNLLSASGVAGIVRRLSGSLGVVFTLHRVLPEPPRAFSPNAILQVTPQFLEAVILRARALNMDLVSLDEALGRVRQGRSRRPFAVLTFDDGYRDNLTHALPVLRKHQCPFTLYVPTAFVDGEGELWWQALEDIIATAPGIADVKGRNLPCRNLKEKNAAFSAVYWQMRNMPEPDRVEFIHNLARVHGFDLFAQCRDLIMDWSELQTFVDEPLCTIGAHTVRHHELSKLPAEEALSEMKRSADILEKRTGTRPRHLSYPIGSARAAHRREYDMARQLGFASAVTTIPGGLYPYHADSLTALPRISLNGYFQNRRYIDVFLTGAIFSAIGERMG